MRGGCGAHVEVGFGDEAVLGGVHKLRVLWATVDVATCLDRHRRGLLDIRSVVEAARDGAWVVHVCAYFSALVVQINMQRAGGWTMCYRSCSTPQVGLT